MLSSFLTEYILEKRLLVSTGSKVIVYMVYTMHKTGEGHAQLLPLKEHLGEASPRVHR